MSLAKNIPLYVISNAIKAGVPFLLLPVFTVYLGPNDYGKMAFYLAIYSFIRPFLIFGAESVLMNQYYTEPKEAFYLDFTKSITNSYLALCCFTLITSIFVYFKQSELNISLWLICLMLFADILVRYTFIIYKIIQVPIKYLKLAILLNTIILGFTLLFLVGFQLGWEARLLGIFTANTLVFAFCLRALKKTISFNFNFSFSDLYNRYKHIVPILPAIILMLVFFVMDKAWIKYEFGNDALGIYAIAFQLASALFFLTNGIRMAWQPKSMQWLSNSKPKDEILKTLLILIVIVCLAALVLYGLAFLVYQYLIGTEYQLGFQQYLLPNITAFVLLAFSQLLFGFVIFFDKLKITGVFALIAISIKVILNVFLGNLYGVLGIIYAFNIAILFFLMGLVFLVWGNLKKIGNNSLVK